MCFYMYMYVHSFSVITSNSRVYPTQTTSTTFCFATVRPTTCTACSQSRISTAILSTMGQTISTTQFFLYGKKHFTKTGYLNHVKNYTDKVQSQVCVLPLTSPEADGVDLNGKIYVVTGANSGIGKQVATYLASKGAKLYLVCRNAARASEAQESIKSQTHNESVHVLLADVGELSQVKQVADELYRSEAYLDGLVCNAGVLLNQRSNTSQGLEATMASHLIGGSYLLAKLLIPLLEKATEPRVIFVSSGGAYNTKFPQWDVAMGTTQKDKDNYNGNLSYAYAKRGQILLAEKWTTDYPKIKWVSCHPGWTDTPAVEAAYGSKKSILEPMRDEWQGAEGIAWLASTAGANLESGQFYLDRAPQRKHLAGPFFSDGSFTKNEPEEVDEMMQNLAKVCGV